MILGWRLFLHSMRMVVRSWRAAVKICLVPVLYICAIEVALSEIGGLSALTTTEGPEQDIVGLSAIRWFVLYCFAYCLPLIWMSVAWHRFILLEDVPNGWVPTFFSLNILSYFTPFILLGVRLMLLFFAYFFISFVVFGETILSNPFIGVAVPGAAILFVFLRYGVVLPASAIGSPLKLSEAWTATSGSSLAILPLVILQLPFEFVLNLIATGLAGYPPVLDVLFRTATSVIEPLFWTTFLTAMYGYYVEGSSLG